jgi:sugar/nucleoside kinase (ribokinase family)
MPRILAAIAFLSASLASIAQAAPNTREDAAQELVDAGLKKAKADGKAVFVTFGATGEMWSEHLEKFNKRPAVKKILDKHLVFVKVDLADTAGAGDLYLKYAKDENAGVPFWVILAPDGKVLADAFDGNKMNVGFPNEEDELKHYKKAIKKAIPKLTDAEVDTLMTELKAEGSK